MCMIKKLTLQRSLSKFMGNVHASGIKERMKTKEGRSCIPIDYLINLAHDCLSGKKGMSLLALWIYGTVIFSRIKGYVEEEVVKVFVGMERGANPTILILTETFRSLSYCRVQRQRKILQLRSNAFYMDFQ